MKYKKKKHSINQISILETNYFELEAILKYVNQETDAENIRDCVMFPLMKPEE